MHQKYPSLPPPFLAPAHRAHGLLRSAAQNQQRYHLLKRLERAAQCGQSLEKICAEVAGTVSFSPFCSFSVRFFCSHMQFACAAFFFFFFFSLHLLLCAFARPPLFLCVQTLARSWRRWPTPRGCRVWSPSSATSTPRPSSPSQTPWSSTKTSVCVYFWTLGLRLWTGF